MPVQLHHALTGPTLTEDLDPFKGAKSHLSMPCLKRARPLIQQDECPT